MDGSILIQWGEVKQERINMAIAIHAPFTMVYIPGCDTWRIIPEKAHGFHNHKGRVPIPWKIPGDP